MEPKNENKDPKNKPLGEVPREDEPHPWDEETETWRRICGTDKKELEEKSKAVSPEPPPA